MRHQTIRQTDGYTDATQLPIDDSIKNLPRLEDHTQIGAQILGADSQNVAQADAKREGVKTDKTIDISGVCPTLTLPVAEIKMERAKGFEPSTFTLAT